MRSSQALLFATLAAVVKAAPQGYATPNNTHPSIDDCKYHGVNNGTFDYDAVSYRESGARNTLDWRIWLLYKCNPISFWHDVPLYPFPGNTSIINLVVEIPRWTDGKIELESSEPLAPIFHDERKGSPRFVESVYPHKSYPFVYGSVSSTHPALPQP
jgi:inorganic pyrophosphatase